MRIFLIAGKARSGKFCVAQCIKKYFDQKNEKTIVTEYSKYIKLFACEMLDWEFNTEPKPRKFLQNMGTFIRNNLNQPNFLVERMLEDIKIYAKFYNNIIISDVRFPDEIDKIKINYPESYSFYIINEHGNYDLTKEEANHESEHALDEYNDFDYIIVNDNKKDLERKMQEILGDLK